MSKKPTAPSGAIRPFGWQDKLGYAMGDMGCGFTFQLISTYMQLFYLQCIGIESKHYGWIILASKAFDAVNDVVIGNLVDTKRIGKKSKYMPWIIYGAIGLVAFTVMLFFPVQSFSYGMKIAWCFIAYCLWSIAYTMVNVPYGSLLSVISDKPNERQALSTFRSIGAALPALIIMMILPNIVYKDGSAAATATNSAVNTAADAISKVVSTATDAVDEILDGNALFIASAVFSIAALVTLCATTKLVKERVVHEEVQKGESSSGAKAFFGAFKSFFTNRAMVGATIASVSSVALFNSTMSLNNMVFQYFFNDTSKITISMVGSYLPMVVVMGVIGKITAKYGKKTVVTVATFISTVAGLAIMLLPLPQNMTGIIIYIVALMFLNTGNCTFQVTVWAIVADCIETSYRKTKKSEEGSLYALYSFFRKLSQGIGQAVVSFGLAAIGFVEGENATQPESFGADVKSLYFVLLFVGSLVTFLSLKFIYNIGKKEEEDLQAK